MHFHGHGHGYLLALTYFTNNIRHKLQVLVETTLSILFSLIKSEDYFRHVVIRLRSGEPCAGTR